MQIIIKTTNNQNIILDINGSENIENIKQKIQDKTGILIDNQHIFIGTTMTEDNRKSIFCQKDLDNNDKISDHILHNDNDFYLLCRPPKCERKINVIIMGFNEQFKVYGSRLDTVIYIKEQIQEQKNIPIHQQNLFFCNKKLENHKKLGDYNIQVGSTVHLVVN